LKILKSGVAIVKLNGYVRGIRVVLGGIDG